MSFYFEGVSFQLHPWLSLDGSQLRIACCGTSIIGESRIEPISSHCGGSVPELHRGIRQRGHWITFQFPARSFYIVTSSMLALFRRRSMSDYLLVLIYDDSADTFCSG
jgi:hypothetical protein